MYPSLSKVTALVISLRSDYVRIFILWMLLMSFANTALSQFVDVTAQQFTDLPPVRDGKLAWGDYNNDGRLDLILTGYTIADNGNSGNLSRVYQNTASGFVHQPNLIADLPQVNYGSVYWADFINNGQLGLMISGNVDVSPMIGKLFYNTPSGFVDQSKLISTIKFNYNTFLAWGDYDNDGLVDLMVVGNNDPSSNHYPQLYRNTGTSFIEQKGLLPNLPLISDGSSAWGDYDNDGRLDLMVSGRDYMGTDYAKLYRNVGGSFTDESKLLQGVRGAPTWVDYDNDGRLDLFTSGPAFNLYRNTPSGFVNQRNFISGPEVPTEIVAGRVAWGDYDNDGRLDLLISGQTRSDAYITKLYRNTTSGFVDSSTLLPNLPQLLGGAMAWGDYDNDGRLDLMLTGTVERGATSKLYRNITPAANTQPTRPTGLTSAPSTDGTKVYLNWQPATDDQTPQLGLSYNLYVSQTPGGQNIVSPEADQVSGLRRVVRPGNSRATNFPLTGLTPGQTYYWSVQAIDGAFAGSPFASEQMFTMPKSSTPLPVQLASFSGQWQSGVGSQLRWMTSWETDSDYFEIQAGRDARSFERIGQVRAQGHSTTTQEYTFIDAHPQAAITYYRLKQLDQNGRLSYSKIIAIEQGAMTSDLSLVLYPNPTSALLEVQLNSGQRAGSISVFNAQGYRVLESPGDSLKLAVNALSSGVYVVEVKTISGHLLRQRFVKQ